MDEASMLATMGGFLSQQLGGMATATEAGDPVGSGAEGSGTEDGAEHALPVLHVDVGACMRASKRTTNRAARRFSTSAC